MRNAIPVSICAALVAATTVVFAAETPFGERRLGAETFRTAIMGRGQFMPGDTLVVDKCSLDDVLTPVQIDSLYQRVRRIVQFQGCGYDAVLSGREVEWKFTGALDFYPEVILGVNIRKPRWGASHRETYAIENGTRLRRITLSHFGTRD